MSTEFTPVFQGTAIQLKGDFSNIREVALFVGGSIITNSRSDRKPAIRMSDNAHILNAGQYVVLMADGTMKKMYRYDFEDMFGTDTSCGVDTPFVPEDRDFDSFHVATLTQQEKNGLMWPVYGALEATMFKNSRRTKAMEKPLFKAYAEEYEKATGAPLTLEIAKSIFGSHDMSYKQDNGRYSFVLPERNGEKYDLYLNVDATPEDVQAARNRKFLRDNPDFYADFICSEGAEEEG